MISVIVPVYKVENYLCKCLDSILAQTFTNYELILVDDGSPDNCGKICDEYSKKDSRIHVIHKKNGGLSDARNAGIDWAFANSNSEWITFIDSDDWIHPRYLEALYNAINRTGCEISICGYEETTGDNPVVDESKLQAVTVNTEIFFCEHNVNAVVAWAKIYKKELFKEIRYPVSMLHEDEFATYKILFKYEEIAFVDQPLYFYFQNENSVTNSIWNPKRLAAIDALKQQIVFFRGNNYIRAYKKAVCNLLWIYSNYIMVLKSQKQYKTLRGKLKKELQYLLKQYENELSFNKYSQGKYYEVAYPLEMKVYWTIQGIKNHLTSKKLD